jgi:glutamate/tyrosine decarboxylase-like PLP-dependent enzyme
VRGDERGKLQAAALEEAIAAVPPADLERVFAVVATSGTTNCGIVDDLKAVRCYTLVRTITQAAGHSVTYVVS